MCGISGFIDYKKLGDEDLIKSMTNSLHHRGPDDAGVFIEEIGDAIVAIGHRRLSIIDLSKNGHQPMAYENLVIAYNGEVYNFNEIRSDLIELGHSFKSNSDTEVIIKSFHEWGNACVNRFNGMFAIAILDRFGKLTLIRDRLGVKPLYWYCKNGLFMFSSELKSFHRNPEFQKEIYCDALRLYFQYAYIPQPYTIFKDAYKLECGSILEFDIKSRDISIKKYWDVADNYLMPKHDISEQEAKQKVKDLLKSSAEYRMVSDVPVGIFLSGGYDSSTLAAILQAQSTAPLKTYSIGFSDEKFDEAKHAKTVATHLGTNHTEYYCEQKDAMEMLSLVPDTWDEPFADHSILPTLLVSKLASKDVKVALSADGGDELFGGYEKYTASMRILDLQKKIPNKNIVRKLVNSFNDVKWVMAKAVKNFDGNYDRYTSFLNSDTSVAVMSNFQKIFSEDCAKNIITKTTQTLKTSFEVDQLTDLFDSSIDSMLSVDAKTYLVDDILVKVDRATMHYSIEGREPFLDYRLFEFVSRLDDKMKIKNGTKKYLLKQICHDYLPAEIMDRQKMGFSAPILEWFRGEAGVLFDEYLTESKLKSHGLLNVSYVRMLYTNFKRGESFAINKLWLILMFQMWYERWFEIEYSK